MESCAQLRTCNIDAEYKKPTNLVGIALSALAVVNFLPAETKAQQISVEEIVVTARQREESLQDIPLSISAFTAADIEKAGFRDLGDIAIQTAGIQFNVNQSGPQGGRLNASIRMRGIAVGSSLPHLQPVSLFVDGVYSLGGAQVLPIQDLERVEVIKGPQSAFFGRNTFAGAINYITRKPSLSGYEGKVSVSGATYDQYDASVQHTGPLVEGKLGYLANVRLNSKGSMFTATDGGRLGEQSSKSASLALYSEPSENLDVKVRVFYQEDSDGPAQEGSIRGRVFDNCNGKSYQGLDENGASVTLNASNFICGQIPSIDALGSSIVSTNTSLRPAIFAQVRPGFDGELSLPTAVMARPDFLIEQALGRKYIPGVPDLDGFGMERRTLRTSLNANWAFADGYTATLTAGYNDMSVNWLLDFDRTDVESWYSVDPQTGVDKSAELRVSSPGENRFRWLAGATYYQQKFVTSGTGGLAITACFITCATGPGNFALPATSGDRAKVWATYGAVSYDIVENLTLDLEFRYMEDQRTNTQSQGAGFSEFTDTFKQKTPRAILTYKPYEGTTIYTQVSRGTLPGVINGLVAICSNDSFLQPYVSPVTGQLSTDSECAQIASQLPGGEAIASSPSQYLDSLEIGWKQTFDDDAGYFNLTGYYYKWKDQTRSVSVRYFRDADDPTLRDRLPNAFPNTLAVATSGTSKSKGVDLEASYLVNENLSLSGNVSWNDNKFSDLVSVGGFVSEVFGVPNTNLRGTRQTRYPEWMGSASVAYTDQLNSDWDWFVRGDASYFGKAYADVANISYTDNYWIANVRAGVEKEDFRLEFFVRNLFQERAWAGASSVNDFAAQGDFSFASYALIVTPQDKRTFGLRLNHSF